MLASVKKTSRPWLVATAAATLIAAALVLAPAAAQANGCITNTPGVSDGTAAHPFLIENVENLQCMRDNAEYLSAGLYFKQTADIDLSAQPTWTTTIGDANFPFAGSFDGDGKKIIGLDVMHAEAQNSGLFGVTDGATLANLYLEDATASLTTGNNTNWWGVGALVGLADHETHISNVHSTGTVTGQYAGGIAGWLREGSDISSSSSAAVIVGYLWCAGGLVGAIDEGGSHSSVVSDSSATGPVSGGIFIGGLIGGIWSQAAPVTVTRSFASGNVTVAALGEGYAGGLVGLLSHEPSSGTAISESFATGGVTFSDPRSDAASNSIGGLVGASNVNGSVASAGNSITDSYSTGTLTGVGPVGGVAGKNYAGNLTISNTYSRSAVHGVESAVGGILGAFSPTAPTITASFWNPTDADNTHANSYGTESTQTQMKTDALYANASWDISSTLPTTKKWVICAAHNDGYPFLQWYAAQQNWTCSPAPSNLFTVRLDGASTANLMTVITVPGAGNASQAGSFYAAGTARSARAVTACRGSKKISKAGRYRVSCKLTSAARSARRRHAIRVTLRTTFTPTGGAARTVTRTVTLKKTSSGVTG